MTAKISDIPLGKQITLSVKYKGPCIIFNDGTYLKSRNRPIELSDYLMGDNYFYPIYRVLKSKLKFGYYKFTSCTDGSVYMDIGQENIPGAISNDSTYVNINKNWKHILEASDNFEAVATVIGLAEQHIHIDKIVIRDDTGTYYINSNEIKKRYQQTIDDFMLTTDIISNVSVGSLNNILPTKNQDGMMIKAATELFFEYINSTKYDISGMLTSIPHYLKNKYIDEKIDLIGDYRFSELVKRNQQYYDVFCFILAMLKRGKLIANPLIKFNHIKKYAAISNCISNLQAKYAC